MTKAFKKKAQNQNKLLHFDKKPKLCSIIKIHVHDKNIFVRN